MLGTYMAYLLPFIILGILVLLMLAMAMSGLHSEPQLSFSGSPGTRSYASLFYSVIN